MADALDTIGALPATDRVRAALAACPDGLRPAVLDHAIDVPDLRAVTESLEAAGELEFTAGRLRVPSEAAGDPARAALAGLDDDARRALHRALAGAIGRASYEPGIAELEQAWHELQAGDLDSGDARLRRAAAEAARAADHVLVVRAYDQLDAHGRELAADERERRARAALEAGDPRAHELWAAALGTWEQERAAGDGDDEPVARAVVSWFWSNPDDPAAAERLTQVAAAATATTGWAWYARAVVAIFDADWERAIEPLEHALGAARERGDRELEAAVLGSLATARSYLGQLDVAIDLLRRSAPVAAASADAVTIRRIRHNLVETLVEALRTGEAIEEAKRFTADLQRLGARAYVPGALALEARVRALAGDTARARSLASQALAADRALDELQRDVYVHMVAAELLALGGDTDRFRGFVDDVRSRSAEFGFGSYDEALDEVVARAALVSGEVRTLAGVLERAEPSEPTGLATLALAGARLRGEGGAADVARAHDSVLAKLDALDAVTQAIPLVALARREGAAAAARDRAALLEVAQAWDDARRPVDAALVRRAAELLAPDEVEAARIAAQLESLGWGAIAARGAQLDPDLDPDAAAHLPITSIELVAQLPPAERAAVLAAIETVELEPPGGGDDELHAVAPAGVCIVARGEVRLLRAEPGSTDRRLVVAALGPGDVFGHESVGGADAATGALVEAAVSSLLHVLPAEGLGELTAQAPAFTAALLADASERLGEARLLAGESALLPVETRLARTLVRLADRFGRPSLRGELLLDTSLTHADIASMIGSQRARVSSLLGALHKAGITDTWKRRIVVLDLAQLRARAGLA